MAEKTDKKDFIATARERFKQAIDAESDNRDKHVKDLKFVMGEQWDETTRGLRESAGRPVPVINKTKGNIKVLIGEARQNRPKIKVRAVDNQQDPRTAQIYDGLINNIQNVSDADDAYDCGIEGAVKGNIGYWRITTDYADDTAFDQDILIERVVNPLNVFCDPAAKKVDRSDARFYFICDMMDKKEFERRYPKASTQASVDSTTGQASDDWFTSEGIRIAEYWYKERATKYLYMLEDGRTIKLDKAEKGIMVDPMTGQPINVLVIDGQPVPYKKERKAECDIVKWCKINGVEILEEVQEWPGKYIPIVPCLGEETWIEGKCVLTSAHHDGQDAQRLYNWSRANSIETLAQAPKQPFLGTPEMFKGHEAQWDNMHTNPASRLLYNPDPQAPNAQPQRQNPSVPNVGAREEAMIASEDLKATLGRFDPSVGAESQAKSGIAIARLQNQGNAATFVYTDNQTRAIKYTGKILVDLIPKIYDGERVVRLLGEDGREAWETINQRTIDPVTGEVRVLNDLSVGRFDVVVDTSAGYLTKRMESAEMLSQITQAAPVVAPVTLPRIVKAFDMPDADQIGQEIQMIMQPPPPPPPPEPSPKDMLDVEKSKMDLQGKQIDLESKKLDLQLKGVEGMQAMQQIAEQTTVNVLRQIGLIGGSQQ